MDDCARVIIAPSSPALVKELAPADQASHELRGSVEKLLSAFAVDTPVEIVGSTNDAYRTTHEGSFRAWGAPQVQVGGGNHLAELVARYLLGKRQAYVREFRSHLGQLHNDCITIVMLDGSAGLTARAPLALVESGAAADQWCQEVLKGNAPEQWTKEQLERAGVVEPELWLELALRTPRQATLHKADSSTGVGRYVAEWAV